MTSETHRDVLEMARLLDASDDVTLLPLLAYLSHRRLDRTEVNALLKVAQLMFR